MPLAAISNMGDINVGPKLFKIIEATISYLENRYDTPIQYHHNWRVILLTHEEIQQRWCNNKNDIKKYADCVSAGEIYAYYEVLSGSIILPRSMNLDDTHDVASVVHEVVHFVQDKHGLTWRGNNHKCMEWLELEAMTIEMEIVKLLELRRPSWYLSHNNEYQKKWRSELDANGNCV
jgi:hypothetical protein